MNVRLLIIFGLVLQLFAVKANARCANGSDEMPTVAQAVDACGGCCTPGDTEPEPEPDPTSPCEACPICSGITSEPNSQGVLQSELGARAFAKAIPTLWSVVSEHDALRRAHAAMRLDTPLVAIRAQAPDALCRWLT